MVSLFFFAAQKLPATYVVNLIYDMFVLDNAVGSLGRYFFPSSPHLTKVAMGTHTDGKKKAERTSIAHIYAARVHLTLTAIGLTHF